MSAFAPTPLLGIGAATPSAARLRGALAVRQPRGLDIQGFRNASVLVPILERPTGPTLLFTRRTESVRQHKGQISFPGGRREPGEDAVRAALRETEEEVGVDAGSVEVLGVLDDLPSTSGYVVTPVVGLVAEPPDTFAAQESEVALPFEVPLTTLMDPGRLRVEWWEARRGAALPPATLQALRLASGDWDPATERYRVFFFDVGPDAGGAVWGLTARILRDFLVRGFGFPG